MVDNYLCEDLIADIFIRLPAKSLVQFRSLSKSWCSRIASPSFIQKYTQRSQENSSSKFLVRYRGWSWSGSDDQMFLDLYGLHSEERLLSCHGASYIDILKVEFPYFDPDNIPEIVNSCNGILCLRDYTTYRISLWNPSIRYKVSLPVHPSVQSNPRLYGTAFGLGFDPVTDDYKVVIVSNDHGNKELPKYETISYVYSMKTRSWRQIPSAYPFWQISPDACFLNVSLHWVAKTLTDTFILTFNLSTHVFGKITLPKPRWTTEKLTVINGCLAVISYESGFSCWIWVMKEYNNASSWYPLFIMETDDDIKGGTKGVLQLITDGYFLINIFLGGIEIKDLLTGFGSVFQGSFHELEMATCLETIELLDIGERDE